MTDDRKSYKHREAAKQKLRDAAISGSKKRQSLAVKWADSAAKRKAPVTLAKLKFMEGGE